ncbi:2-octaprenyl-6-methoxyphenyl hydroxylase [Thalassotalea agarivorans]|uniref:2-octaprenyl-6-methoxyphenol hydroxylase n=1 Tax=Thalassotalea agarivorans TaxID=349064 RepID=A0A1I0HFP2_THASX|nr:2-octaprenyl-6-methoxyphenyl hydroxylase [Thalassotalea agarivorans]SET82574.1 2-octaprenyl-6-methoxyphenol hydroxylase [Thalassotalea agarivorans]
MNNSVDIVIAGGGLSGLLLARSLITSSPSLSIAVVESQSISFKQANQFDQRVLALSHHSAKYLEKIGVWPACQAHATAINHIHISDRGNYGKARIDACDHNVEALGYVIAMADLGKALQDSVNNADNICWYSPDSIVAFEQHQQHVDITLDSGSNLQAKLLLACDGGQSKIRQSLSIDTIESEYAQSAIVCNLEMEKAHLGKAYERFTSHGPIAMLPLKQTNTSLVWTTTPEQALALINADTQEFTKQLEKAFGYWLGSVVKVGERGSFPLSLVQAKQNISHRIALIGNASHTIHPIAGQGFNLGLRDVELMATLVQQAIVQQQDIGQLALLSQYQQQRLSDQQAIISLTDSLVTLFSNDHAPLVAGRNIALKVLNYVSPLKQAFVNKTMGYK